MGFDHVLMAPLFAPGAVNDIFLTADHERIHPAIHPDLDVDTAVSDLAQECRQHGLDLFLEIVVGSVARDAKTAQLHPSWFAAGVANGQTIDPRSILRQPAAAYLRFDDPAIAEEAAAWWIERLRRLAGAGAAGFCFSQPHQVPAAVWQRIIPAASEGSRELRFVAWTPGLTWKDINNLRGAGFDGTFSSSPWWDGRASWFVEEHELLRTLGSVIAAPEAPFGPRLARRLGAVDDPTPLYRHMLRRAAAIGDGLMLPMGFEYAATEEMDARQVAPDESLLRPPCSAVDLSAEIREANALSNKVSQLRLNGEMRNLTNPVQPATVLLRCDASSARDGSAPIVIAINTDLQHERALPISLDPLPAAAGAALVARSPIIAERDPNAVLAPGEIRVLQAQRSAPVKLPRPRIQPTKLAKAARLVVDNVVPSVDGGRFAARRVVGEPIDIEADVFVDGHEVLCVELLWHSMDQQEWHRVPMRSLNNDRWRATITPERVGRYEFTIAGWIDKYATLARDIELKSAARTDISSEVAEARLLLQRAHERARCSTQRVLATTLSWLDDASVDECRDILLTQDLREVMHEAGPRDFEYCREPALSLDIERPQALFASWYELFPRSASTVPDRHGTFDDVIARLPALKDMGFDVLYLPPISPIGTTNRKGKNNALRAEPDDVGSPYAIGSSEGGHTAIHPALGSIEDFHRLRDAALAHGMELALDFAIQCSPDHPWLKEHPDWFNWRPDGSIRYAENPPKKYEDIVNVDFYAKGAVPNLWLALRDVVLFWIGEGIKTFRVDNPHTKPLPFWEWLIAQIRSEFPEVIFLSEAFTRPKMMYRLAKVGFSQSYTYFTWRNTKRELTDYFTELTTSDAREFFRPHLFVNTPDINPPFLQTSGRPGFLIRAALATTLSGLWGMYSGFELCEAAPLPGREEYLYSEKYQIRVRRYDAPGNIVAEIAKLNRIRRAHPALQSHLGLRFYPAHSDQVLYYGKRHRTANDLILCAVSLDPFNVQEVTIEVPLWEWNLPDHASFKVTDLMRDSESTRSGKLQRLRLDPAELPFAIWRVIPLEG